MLSWIWLTFEICLASYVTWKSTDFHLAVSRSRSESLNQLKLRPVPCAGHSGHQLATI